ncbi:hypothetical protein RND81_06G198800 [Saponaria officinalis]|uniref:KOW domain-containing protein n=1 Tax=Saponaria officinalis TaxID=3572 RepID=A0AAW1K8E9_SAPOF
MGWKAAQKLIQNWKILRGDNVMIIRGKDRGEIGLVKRVIRSQNRLIVEGKNLGQGHEGGIFSVEAPLHCQMFKLIQLQVSRGIGASGTIIPRPEILKMRTTPRPTASGPKDTPMDLVMERTYDPKTGKGMLEL